jgi:hypothetical protein
LAQPDLTTSLPFEPCATASSTGAGRATARTLGSSTIVSPDIALPVRILDEAVIVDQAVASNKGIHMLPDLNTQYPSGMGGLTWMTPH